MVENRPRNPRRLHDCEAMRKAEPMRILVAFGARPKIIKLGPVCQALRRKRRVTMDVFWSGPSRDGAAFVRARQGEEVRFAPDSLVEGSGFELLVPRRIGNGFNAPARWVPIDRRRGSFIRAVAPSANVSTTSIRRLRWG